MFMSRRGCHLLRRAVGITRPPAPHPLHSLIANLEGDDNLQTSSPLFTTIPPELRNFIFRLALFSYDDKASPYPENTHYNRPGYRFKHRIDTALLSTCRVIYRETYILPVSLNEHVFWGGKSRGPPHTRFCDDPVQLLSCLTVEQRAAVDVVHLFTQMYWLDKLPELCHSEFFRMKHLKITIRHSDWWYWESNNPLSMKETWTDNLKEITTLETLEVEMETMERDKSQLEAIVKRMKSWRVDLAHGNILVVDDQRATHSRYLGPWRYDVYEYDAHRKGWVISSRGPRDEASVALQLPYVVYTVIWTKSNA